MNFKEFLEFNKSTKEFLDEAVYGNMATVFHRTSISDLVNKVFDSGFKPGDGAMYGKGFYSTYDLESQLRSNMENTYGPIVVKFACPISTFFVFDYEEFIKSPNFKKLGKPSPDEFLKAQFEFFKMDYSDFDFRKYRKNELSSNNALWCTKNILNFQKLCEGIVFTGSRDGKVLVSYNTKLIFPLSYSVNNGETWERVERNLDYLKKVAKVKANFTPDLSVRPEDFEIKDYEFNSEGFLNVKGDVELSNRNLVNLPFKFGVVAGSFYCNSNKLTSLEGAPKEVGEDFNCVNNKLTSLEGGPKEVSGDFYCANNELTSLEGAPKEVGRSFYCQNNKLTSLKGSPENVGRDFYCHNNKLTSLEGAPKEVGGDFYCPDNKVAFTFGDIRKVSNVKSLG
ncbi:MAG: hypothetical protein WC942_08170 [Clostridia bacterium]|jgi:hypothetical protein